MLASSSTVAPKPAAAMPPAAQQPSQPANTAGTPSFAQFLTIQAGPPAPPAHTDPEPSQPDTSAEPAPAAPAPAARKAPAQPAKPTAQNRAEGTAKADAKAPADKTDADTATDAVTASDDKDDDAETPELKEFTQLIGMNSAQPDTAAAARHDTHRGHASAADGADDTAKGRPALQAATDKGRPGDTPEPAAAKPGDLRADKSTARATTSTETLQAATQHAGSDQPAAAPAPAAPSFAAALAQALPPPTTLPDAAPAATYASVQAPLHTDAFAPEIGARVSLLAVDGVQQAELQLNPADMGPVSVQITVDGNQAQVSFHAVQAETRAALEQSLPDLAAALQGQGLTLSGGGVFQQAQRDADHGDDRADNTGTSRSSRGGNDRIGSTANVAAAPARRTVGLVDTFA